MPDELVRAESVTKVFRTRAGEVRAVDDVTLTVRRGQTLGLVGESGSGKSTMARLMMGLQTPTSGRVEFDGKVLTLPTTYDQAVKERDAIAAANDGIAALMPSLASATALDMADVIFGEADCA